MRCLAWAVESCQHKPWENFDYKADEDSRGDGRPESRD